MTATATVIDVASNVIAEELREGSAANSGRII
jgi:hypothetical protein